MGILHSLSLAYRLGRSVLQARLERRDPVEAMVAQGSGKLLFRYPQNVVERGAFLCAYSAYGLRDGVWKLVKGVTPLTISCRHPGAESPMCRGRPREGLDEGRSNPGTSCVSKRGTLSLCGSPICFPVGGGV